MGGVRRLEHAVVSERDIRRETRRLIRRKAQRAATGRAGAAVDEWIEHQRQELIHRFECGGLGVNRRFAVELVQRIGQRRPGEPEHGRKIRRQRAAVVEEIVQRGGDVVLIDGEIAAQTEDCREVQDHVGRGVAQVGLEIRRTGDDARERRAAEAARLQNVVAPWHHIGAGREKCLHRAGERSGAGYRRSKCGGRRVELHQIDGA